MKRIFYNRKGSIEFYTYKYLCPRQSQYNLWITQIDKLRPIKRAKDQRNKQKYQQKLASVNKYIDQVHKPS